MSASAVQNFQATTLDVGATKTHHSNGADPDATRWSKATGSMKANGDALG